MKKSARLLYLITLISVLVACGSTPSGGDEPGGQALRASPAATARQATSPPTPPATVVEPTATLTAEPTAGAPTAETPTAAAPTATNTLTAVPPTEVPVETPTEPSPKVPMSTSDVQRITATEAKSLLDSGEAMLYDTRSAAAYDAVHAAGALSFPEAEAAARFAELPTDKSLVFY